MVETYGLTHLAFGASDPARSARFYEDVFGCVIAFKDAWKVELQTPGRHDVIALERATEGVGSKGGIAHFGFRLVRPEDIDDAVEAVLRAGGTLERRGEFAPGYPFAFVRDLDGYTVEIWFE